MQRLRLKNNFTQHHGFLTITAVILLVSVAVLTSALFYMFTASSRSSTDLLTSVQALYVAESGLETAIQAIAGPSVGSHISCAAVNGYTNVAIGGGAPGTYTLQGTLSVANSPGALSSAINSTTSIIPLTTIAPYNAAGGRVMIDLEAIDYTGVSSLAAVCGTAPCLTGGSRGAGGTTASNHAAGTGVGQNDCMIRSTGTVSTANLNSQRTVYVSVQNDEGWTTGQTDSGDEMIMRWNGTTFDRILPAPTIPDTRLYDIKMLSYVDGWIVGSHVKVSGTNQVVPEILHWNGALWSHVVPSVSSSINSDLYAVDCLSADDCWAVGQKNSNTLLIMRWNGSQWTRFSQSGNALDLNLDLYGIDCVSTNDCWAVGQKTSNGNNGDLLFMHWNGSSWSQVALTGANVKQDLRDVFCISSSDCWAVGDKQGSNSAFTHWNGSQWLQGAGDASIPSGANFHAIECLTGSDCWAVGDFINGDTLIAYYNGSIWSRVIPDNSVPDNRDLLDIDCLASNDCWAVGEGEGGDVLTVHWDGSVWSRIDTTNDSSTSDLEAIALLGAQGSLTAAWQEDFH
ncbi:MAG: hypothetical protein K0R12_297 [Gammaproteobacteria bacterium]|nr:hypothetical protein [Gammaproteobacteria bacterium]